MVEKTEKTRRFYEHSLISYLSEEYIINILNDKINQIAEYAYILHDKDDGKKAHTHIYLKVHNAKTLENVRKWFEVPSLNEKAKSEPVKNKSSLIKYFLHKTEESKEDGKFQYNDTDLKTYKLCLNENENKDETANILEDLIEGVPLVEMVKKYGRLFVYHYQQYKMLYNDIMQLDWVENRFQLEEIKRGLNNEKQSL